MEIMSTAQVSSFPALSGEVVTEAHAKVCATRGHATHKVNGIATATCPRCGDITRPAAKAAPVVVDVFAGRPEARTSYGNQRGLAARDRGGDVRCIHSATLADGCPLCRASGSVLILGA